MSVVLIDRSAYDSECLARETMPDDYAFYAADTLMDAFLPESSTTSTASMSGGLPGDVDAQDIPVRTLSATGDTNPEGVTVPRPGSEASLMTDGAGLPPGGTTSAV